MKSNRRIPLAAVCCLIVILSAGCAALSPFTAGEPIEARVKQYMQAQVDGKWDLAYSFVSASSREQMPRERYVNRVGKVAYKGFEIEEIKILPSGDQATVKVRIEISFMGYDFKRAPQTQDWVKEKGDWVVRPQLQSRRTPVEQEKPK